MIANTNPHRLSAKWATALSVAALVLAGFWAYRNSFSAPFFFDDLPAIVDNRSIRHLGAIGEVLSPPVADGSGVEGRPMVNLSLAINYAWGGLNVEGYHALNLAIHLLAGVTLLGIVRRTLHHRGSEQSMLLGWVVALIWTVHPLLTESVTCVVQRTESMMGLFYLVTLYCFIRGSEAPDRRHGSRWHMLSIAACLVGMGTKEVMVTAPLMVLLYDRTFAAGSFGAAWRARRRYYVGLGATWLGLAYLVVQTGGRRGEAAGFGLGVTGWSYALTQAQAVVMYLKLVFWPRPLVVDYGRGLVTQAGAVGGQLILLAVLLAATVYALFWPEPPISRLRLADRRALGFLGAWFFIILSPSSSVLPLVTQTMAEHRMYLPLASVVTLAVSGLHALIGRLTPFLCLGAAAGLGVLTALRNADYRSALSIWEDTVAKRPANFWAVNNYAVELAKVPGRSAEAVARYEEALRLNPHFAEAHNNLAILLDSEGKTTEAMDHFRRALIDRPSYPQALEGLGIALSRSGRTAEATGLFERALRLKPDYVAAHYNYAVDLAEIPGRLGEAIEEYQAALRLEPDYADAHYNLANALSEVPERLPEAIREYEEALRLKPGNPDAHNNLALAYAHTGRVDLAVQHLEMALKLNPDFAGARENLEKLQGMK